MPEPSAVDTQRVHRGQLVNDDGDTLGPLGTVLQPLLAESGRTAKTFFGDGTGGTLELPAGVEVESEPTGFYREGGHVHMFGTVFIRSAAPQFADILSQSALVLPAMPSGYEIDAELVSGSKAPNLPVYGEEAVVGSVMPAIYYWTDTGTGWYLAVGGGTLDPIPTHDLSLFLSSLPPYPVAA